MSDAERTPVRIEDRDYGAGLGAASVGDITRKDPRVPGRDAIGAFTVDPYLDQRIACSLAMRSAVDGCVENSFEKTPPPPNGMMMNMCAVAGLAYIGMRFE